MLLSSLLTQEENVKLLNFYKKLALASQSNSSELSHYFASKTLDLPNPSLKTKPLWETNFVQCRNCGFLNEKSAKLKIIFKKVNRSKKSVSVKCQKCLSINLLKHVGVVTNREFNKQNEKKGENFNRKKAFAMPLANQIQGKRTLVMTKKIKKPAKEYTPERLVRSEENKIQSETIIDFRPVPEITKIESGPPITIESEIAAFLLNQVSPPSFPSEVPLPVMITNIPENVVGEEATKTEDPKGFNIDQNTNSIYKLFS
jgi:hypothetical protein